MVRRYISVVSMRSLTLLPAFSSGAVPEGLPQPYRGRSHSSCNRDGDHLQFIDAIRPVVST